MVLSTFCVSLCIRITITVLVRIPEAVYVYIAFEHSVPTVLLATVLYSIYGTSTASIKHARHNVLLY